MAGSTAPFLPALSFSGSHELMLVLMENPSLRAALAGLTSWESLKSTHTLSSAPTTSSMLCVDLGSPLCAHWVALRLGSSCQM
jgi:hypothetical protein